MSAAIVGFRALGRHGELGVVVDLEHADASDLATAIVVRGGVSDALTYFVPTELVRLVSSESRSVVLDVDLTDFDACLNEDGTVELRTQAEQASRAWPTTGT